MAVRVDAGAREAVQDVVEQRAALGGARIAQQRLERMQVQYAAGIDSVRVAPQRLDLGDRQPAWSRSQRRSRVRPAGERLAPGVERAGPGQQVVAALAHRVGLVGADEGEQALQPA